MKKELPLIWINKKKKFNSKEFMRLAKRVKKIFEEEQRYYEEKERRDEHHISRQFSFGS